MGDQVRVEGLDADDGSGYSHELSQLHSNYLEQFDMLSAGVPLVLMCLMIIFLSMMTWGQLVFDTSSYGNSTGTL